MSNSEQFVERSVALATGTIAYLEGGHGQPIVFLHHSWGNVGESELHQQLSSSFRVMIPDLPGWGGSERPVWARDVRDVAIIVSNFLEKLELEHVTLVGTGFGGYVAAEVACMNSSRLAQLVLIGSVGVQPQEGEILDQMMFSHRQYIVESFRDQASYVSHFGEEPAEDVRALWDHSREMVARVSWKPYFFNRRLLPLLGDMTVPTLIVWGSEDKVAPLDIANQLDRGIPNSRMEIIQDAGHAVEIEEPLKIAELIAQHIIENV